ncbi:lysylphosphatidylglycerol synthase transmembrane domain-containing protein [Rhabdothermincola sp.]|uniref:lysylphosphatidylglycerol synthase transmembrane domain-containing protein n=1 Tax=Rhabdothermincola sp. TaxID=2820405 RepID=UPI002FDFEC50
MAGESDRAVEANGAEVPTRRPSRWRIIARVVLLVVSATVLYGLLPRVLAVFAQAPRLLELNPLWFVAVLGFEIASFTCVWWLTRIAVPGVSWFVAATSQLVANAVSRIVPGGPAIGTAIGWRMLSVSGVDRTQAGAAIAATSFISNGVLFALPLVAVLGSIFGAPVPRSLALVAWGGALVFVVLFGAAFLVVRFDRPLKLAGTVIERVGHWIYLRVGRPNPPTAAGLIRQRDLVVSALGSRWEQALAAAVGNWLFDYLALVAALYAVGASPHLSLVLLAYGAGAVLGMIPITPGGLGFVEAGLTATLALAGIGGEQALLATLAYRVASYWLPLPAGLGAWIAFRHRYGTPPATTPA